jgi:hypothetical protein
MDGLRASAVFVALSFGASLILSSDAWIIADLFAILGAASAGVYGYRKARNVTEMIATGLLLALAIAFFAMNSL